MRVIAGTARRLQLKTIPGMDTRPTTDRIKETLFNILQPRLYDAAFLDLFSGSGAIAIEALSRGAGSACLVEMNRKAVACIQDNLKHTHLAERAEVISMDVLSALRRLDAQGREFAVIYMDPPYSKGLERDVLTELAHSHIVTPSTLIVVEAALKTDFSYLPELPFSVQRIKEYKTNQHIFLQKNVSCGGQEE